MENSRFVFQVILCMLGLWLAIELVLTAISFAISRLIRRKRVGEIPAGKIDVPRAVAAFFGEVAAAACTHFLVAVTQPFPARKTRLPLNVITTPILLIPGYFCNRSCWLVFGRLLRNCGAAHVYTIDPKPMTGDIREFAKQVAEKVDMILSTTRASQVNLVGHSMGGLIARYYTAELGGARKVGVCVTIASPHHGTAVSRIAPGINAGQMRRGSQFLVALNKSEHVGTSTQLVSIWSRFDNMIVPPTSSVLGGNAKNIVLDGFGHLAMLYSPRVAQLVWDNLNR